MSVLCNVFLMAVRSNVFDCHGCMPWAKLVSIVRMTSRSCIHCGISLGGRVRERDSIAVCISGNICIRGHVDVRDAGCKLLRVAAADDRNVLTCEQHVDVQVIMELLMRVMMMRKQVIQRVMMHMQLSYRTVTKGRWSIGY